MQDNDSKEKIELKKRAYIYALDIINFIDSLDRKDFSIEIISKQLLRGKENFRF